MKALRSPIALAGLLSITFLTATAQAQDVKPGDPATAQKKVAMCIGCHGIPGYQASFPEVHKVPKISGQSAKYIVSALQAYQKGDRKHPTMKGIAASLTEQDMADIGAYYEADGKNLPATPAKVSTASAEVDALLKRGNCISCHGENLNKPIDASYPKLAGQYSDYVYVSLKSYQTDKNPQIGRSNAIMATQAKMFTHAELKQLAAYIGGLGGDLKTVPQSRFKAH
ncbi:MAG TPA: cytochrome c4 [Candidatus Aquabacterium excrementipullorum]|nr:cytochrome c4 [Candidatus Aquabacterium excrementipullorum]